MFFLFSQGWDNFSYLFYILGRSLKYFCILSPCVKRYGQFEAIWKHLIAFNLLFCLLFIELSLRNVPLSMICGFCISVLLLVLFDTVCFIKPLWRLNNHLMHCHARIGSQFISRKETLNIVLPSRLMKLSTLFTDNSWTLWLPTHLCVHTF